MVVEILHPITDESTMYNAGDLVSDPSPRLLELAQPGVTHLGFRIARIYDAGVSAAEQEAREAAFLVDVPDFNRVMAAAEKLGYTLVSLNAPNEFAILAEHLDAQLAAAQAEIASLRQQLEEQAHALLAPAEPPQVDNAEMLAALSSTENAPQEDPEEAPAEGGELAEAAAPPEDSPKSKRGK